MEIPPGAKIFPLKCQILLMSKYQILISICISDKERNKNLAGMIRNWLK
jgi:hypothetical protein